MKENKLTNSAVIFILALICCILWGSATPAIKIGYKLFQIDSTDTMSQILFAGVRFTLAGVLTIVFGSIISGKFLFPKKESWPMVLTLAVFQTIIQYICFYIGLANTIGAKGAIITGMTCFIAILVSALIFKMETLTLPKIIGCLVGFTGILILNFTSDFEFSFSLKGEGALILSTISYAVSSVLMKKYSSKENPIVLSGWQFVVGGLVMIIFSSAMGGKIVPTTPSAWLLMFYLGFLSATAYTIWGLLLKYNPVSKITVFSFATPVFGVLLSILFLNEQINLVQYLIALLLVCAGIVIVNRSVSGQDKGQSSETEN